MISAQTTAPACGDQFYKAFEHKRRSWRAFGSALGVAICLESLVIGVLIGSVTTVHPKKLGQDIVLAIETVALPLPTERQDSQERRQPDKVKPESPPARRIVRVSAVAALPVPSQLSETSSTTAATASSATQTPSSPATATATAAASAVPEALAADLARAYNAKIAAAVQAAFQIPAAASALGFKGRTRVEFSLREGSASGIHIVLTSGFGAVDRAAIQAVQSAVYPAPPTALRGSEGTYQIWVACF